MALYYDSSPSGFSFDKRYAGSLAGITWSNGSEYTYDKNGNLLTDSNKSITGITYNALNLPKQITFSGGDKVEMKVWGKYTNTNNASEVAATNMLLSALSAAFGVSSSSTGESLQLYNALTGNWAVVPTPCLIRHRAIFPKRTSTTFSSM